MEKHIYIMLSHTNTKIGKMIRLFSHFPYNHVSISTSASLSPLYSFARYRYDAALVGGFVEESPLRYLFNGESTKIRIYDIILTEEQFQQFETILTTYKKNHQQYIYDSFYLFRKDNCRSQYQHTCLSFVVSILKNLYILSSTTTINTMKDLTDALSCFPCIETELTPNSQAYYTWGNDKYYEAIPFPKVLIVTCQHFQKLLS